MSITLNPGSGGSVVASESDGTAEHELVIVEWGAVGTRNRVDDVSGKRLPIKISQFDATLLGPNGGLIVDLAPPPSVTLQASQVAGNTNATTTRTITTGLGNWVAGTILINVTSGGVATGTLQIFLEDSFDGGTTWDDLIASAPITFGAAGATQVFSINGNLATSQAQGSPQTQETLGAGAAMVRLGPWGDRIRVREKVSGVSGTPTGPTYVISAVFQR